jgi:hypothetical protein
MAAQTETIPLAIIESVELPREASSSDMVDRLEARLLQTTEPIDIPLRHLFSPGIYYREVTMPAGTYVVGHRHLTKHLNVISKGRCSVLMDGKVREIVGPCVIESGEGVRKVLLIHETTVWATIHPNPTDERDISKLEKAHVVKSVAWQDHHAELEQLKGAIELSNQLALEKSET